MSTSHLPKNNNPWPALVTLLVALLSPPSAVLTFTMC
jgi:hypothetical protein